MNLMEELPGELLSLLLNVTACTSKLSIIILACTSNFFYKIARNYAILHGIERQIKCKDIAYEGSLNILKWARENGCKWDASTCTHAALGGHLDVLMWARENGCEWNSDVYYRAATQGHLHILEWALANGCPWGIFVCQYATQNGHLHVLIWAVSNGCELDLGTQQFAAKTWPSIFHLVRHGRTDMLVLI